MFSWSSWGLSYLVHITPPSSFYSVWRLKAHLKSDISHFSLWTSRQMCLYILWLQAREEMLQIEENWDGWYRIMTDVRAGRVTLLSSGHLVTAPYVRMYGRIVITQYIWNNAENFLFPSNLGFVWQLQSIDKSGDCLQIVWRQLHTKKDNLEEQLVWIINDYTRME